MSDNWISVEDATPKKSGNTLVKINNYDTNVVERYFSGFCGFWTHNMQEVEGVTHWRYLERVTK